VCRCQFCRIKYDLIGKIESYNEDMKFLFVKRKLPSNVIPGGKFNQTPKKANKTLSYIKQLTPRTIEKLYLAYKVDFDMFGYSVEEYLR